jgi:hypothetical protein
VGDEDVTAIGFVEAGAGVVGDARGAVFDVADGGQEVSGLAVVASSGWSEIVSIPTSIVGAGAIGPDLKLDLFVPKNQPNPSFRGQVSLLISIPSARISNQWIGQVSLDRVALGAFSSLSFPLPATLRRILGYGVTDITFTIQLNVAANASPYYLDHLRFH